MVSGSLSAYKGNFACMNGFSALFTQDRVGRLPLMHDTGEACLSIGDQI
jgi:hypothetical protein